MVVIDNAKIVPQISLTIIVAISNSYYHKMILCKLNYVNYVIKVCNLFCIVCNKLQRCEGRRLGY